MQVKKALAAVIATKRHCEGLGWKAGSDLLEERSPVYLNPNLWGNPGRGMWDWERWSSEQ